MMKDAASAGTETIANVVKNVQTKITNVASAARAKKDTTLVEMTDTQTRNVMADIETTSDDIERRNRIERDLIATGIEIRSCTVLYGLAPCV